MGDFTFKRLIAGNTPDLADFPAHAALEAGDLATVTTANRLAKVTDGTAAEDILFVMNDADAQDDRVAAMWVTPDTVFEVLMDSAVGLIGDLVAIAVSGGVISVEAVAVGAPAQFQIVDIVDATARLVLVKRHSGEKVT